MNEDQMNRLMMIAGMCLAVIAAIGTVFLIIMCALDFSFPLTIGAVVLGVATVAFCWATGYFGHKVTGHPLVFSNEAEREVLTPSQRKELRKARGEVVMERALIEIEHEKDNMVHRQIEAANDPNRPPHDTQWTHNPVEKAIKSHERKQRYNDAVDMDRTDPGRY
jgi:hypothetical protein